MGVIVCRQGLGGAADRFRKGGHKIRSEPDFWGSRYWPGSIRMDLPCQGVLLRDRTSTMTSSMLDQVGAALLDDGNRNLIGRGLHRFENRLV